MCSIDMDVKNEYYMGGGHVLSSGWKGLTPKEGSW